MNLSNIALILTAGLLAFTAYLSLQSRKSNEDRFNEIAGKIDQANKKAALEKEMETSAWEAEMESIRKKNEEYAAEIARIERERNAERSVLEMEAEVTAKAAEVAIEAASAPVASAVELNARQQKIKEAASIGEVTDYREEFGFVVLNKGTNNGLTPGMQFAVRRDYFIVGRIQVDSVEEDEAIANVASSSIPVGFTIRKGDAIIMGEDAGIY